MKKCDKDHNGVSALLLLKKMSVCEMKVFVRRNILYGMNVLKYALRCL